MVSYLRFMEDRMQPAARRDGPRMNRRLSRLLLARRISTRARTCSKSDARHATEGRQRVAAAPDPVHGYVFPPLWGPNSFNEGAGMHRVLTAARFIKARMPLGATDLTDDQAFDIAAFVNSKPRPEMTGLDRDYPDKSKKPADTAYGPYADPFPMEQHRFGPFAPIDAYYKSASKPAK